MCHSSDCMWSFISSGRKDVKSNTEKGKKKKKRGDRRNEMAVVSAHSLMLSAFASLSARPFQTPASHSPCGTPPSSASHAGTPHSCHTCGRQNTDNVTVLARPLNTPFLLMFMKINCQRTPRSIPMLSHHWWLRMGKANGLLNKMSLCHRYDYKARRIGPRECRRATRSGCQAAATVSTTSHVITFCLVRVSSRRKVQLSPPPHPNPRLAHDVSVKFSTDERLSGLSGVIRHVGAKSARRAEMVSVSLSLSFRTVPQYLSAYEMVPSAVAHRKLQRH